MSSPDNPGVTVRILREEDAEPLARAVSANRAFLQPWEPIRDESYFTTLGQSRLIDDALLLYAGGVLLPCVILVRGELVGRININNIVRGALQSGDVGYWVAESHGGRGVATAAVTGMLKIAFDSFNLHRIAASTMVSNVRSQRVLAKTGFERIGLAPDFLYINGAWSDSILFQKINPDYYG
ncbi:GNAT family N-acetyltransferase [Kineosporia succinea]|uniref:Ribosomal-protein-alanine N-acetyltransferase n=1 Tax=Kineosporia succinea TaxID=84632 RepID=A0ABT9NZZ8_9ACTN|nr:GNAT family protein [Kineosporia succinea]MDP9826002.1 ribosomal-protein-alanine N-acetyltransferase [Kineosporia succinea]